MTDELTVVSLEPGDIASRCAELRRALAQVPAGASLYVMGPSDLAEVLSRVGTPDAEPWRVLAGPDGLEAWTRKGEGR